MNRLLVIVLIWGLVVTPVLAQSDSSQFVVKVFGGQDTEAPSAPLLSGAPIASTQLDLSWSPATDNFFVSGYVLFRNGVAIATTTQTLYSDTGLVASTTYSYAVRAFDPTFNYSSSSNTLVLTTPAVPIPPPPTTTDSAGGTATRVVLDDIEISPAARAADISIATVRPARFEIRWGRTGSYELGYVVHDTFVRSYKTTITDLEPGTVYQYEVVGFTPFGTRTILEQGQFATTRVQDSFSPVNVQSFSAQRRDVDVALTWRLPPGFRESEVRLVRSQLGFPIHKEDGVVIYQGKGTEFIDRDILSQYSPVYYTAFVIDASGNVSSGAIARVFALRDGVVDTGISDPRIPSDDIPEETIASTSPHIPPGTRMPGLDEIFIDQQTKSWSLGDQTVVLSSTEPFQLRIPRNVVSDTLKTIVVSLTDPTDSRKTFSFVLRLNQAGTAYEAVLPPVQVEGRSRLIIDIYDYESRVVATYQKTIHFTESIHTSTPLFPAWLVSLMFQYSWLLGLPVLAVGLWYLLYRRRDE